MIAHDELAAILDYNTLTGEFRRRVHRSNGAGRLGGKVGTKHPAGYLRISLNGRFYYAHRLAWFYVHKEWPCRLIDHIDGDALNNAIANLRLADHSQNLSNRGPQRNNTSGAKGVYYDSKNGRWCANIWKHGRKYWLGQYRDREHAVAAYRKGAHKLHGEFAHTGGPKL